MTTYQYSVPVSADITNEEASNPVQWHNHKGGVSVTLTDGAATTDTFGNAKYSTSDMARDTFGDGWKATARNNGMPAREMNGDTVVTINGVNGRVRDFVSTGLLREVAPGQFEEATQDDPQGTTEGHQEAGSEDAAVMPDDVLATVNAALEPVPDHALDGLVAAAIGTVTGGTSMDTLINRLVSASGVEPADAKMRAEYIIAAYQAQADHYLTTRAGIDRESLPAFYEAAKQNPRVLDQAMRDQVNGSMKSWKKIADSFVSKTAPTMAALEAAGYPTRKLNGTPEVFIGGMWASVHGAARAGLI